jgi:hypothetical protein
MKNPAVRETAALRGRHRDFFRRLDKFIRNYGQGICGVDEPDCAIREPKSPQLHAK